MTGERRGTLCDREVGIGVEAQGPTRDLADPLVDQRDAARSADGEDPGDVGRPTSGRRDRALQRVDRVVDARGDQFLELGAGDAELGGWAIWQVDRDRGVGVLAEGLLGGPAVGAEVGQRRCVGRIDGIEVGERSAERGVDVGQDRLVEVDTTESLDALGRPRQRVPGVGRGEHRRVEGAATEVVHGHGLTGRDPLHAPVVEGRRLGFRHEDGAGDVRLPNGVAQQVDLERRPRCGVGDHSLLRCRALALERPLHHVPQHERHECLGGIRAPAEEERCGIAQASFEVPCDAGRLRRCPPVRGFADEDLAAVAHEDHRGHHERPGPERKAFDRAVRTGDRRGRERRPEVDPQPVLTHRGSSRARPEVDSSRPYGRGCAARFREIPEPGAGAACGASRWPDVAGGRPGARG